MTKVEAKKTKGKKLTYDEVEYKWLCTITIEHIYKKEAQDDEAIYGTADKS